MLRGQRDEHRLAAAPARFANYCDRTMQAEDTVPEPETALCSQRSWFQFTKFRVVLIRWRTSYECRKRSCQACNCYSICSLLSGKNLLDCIRFSDLNVKDQMEQLVPAYFTWARPHLTLDWLGSATRGAAPYSESHNVRYRWLGRISLAISMTKERLAVSFRHLSVRSYAKHSNPRICLSFSLHSYSDRLQIYSILSALCGADNRARA